MVVPISDLLSNRRLRQSAISFGTTFLWWGLEVMADNTAAIAELRAKLQSGVTNTTVDGTSVAVDLSAIERQLKRLIAEDNTQRSRRPRLSSVNISGLR